ncbi:GpE family phage tail protein, partial [Vibrio parahaemolyticus]
RQRIRYVEAVRSGCGANGGGRFFHGITPVPADVMEAEADIFLVFTGFNPSATASMSLAELMRWHEIALQRHEKAQEQAENAGQS